MLHCEQVPCVWSVMREPQVPWTSHGKMSFAVTHLQPTSLRRGMTCMHWRQPTLPQFSHIIPAAASGARQPNCVIISSLVVRFYQLLMMINLMAAELLLFRSMRPC